SDLKDCLAGDSLVLNADTGERVAVRHIADARKRFNVWAIDERFKLVRKPILGAWSVGEQTIYRLRTLTGRVIRSSAGHRFLSDDGWKRLDELVPGSVIAVQRE